MDYIICINLEVWMIDDERPLGLIKANQIQSLKVTSKLLAHVYTS